MKLKDVKQSDVKQGINEFYVQEYSLLTWTVFVLPPVHCRWRLNRRESWQSKMAVTHRITYKTWTALLLKQLILKPTVTGERKIVSMLQPTLLLYLILLHIHTTINFTHKFTFFRNIYEFIYCQSQTTGLKTTESWQDR